MFLIGHPSTSVGDPLSRFQELSYLPDPTVLPLADILPTGLFVVLQALTHPKLAPIFTGIPWPRNVGQPAWGTPLSGSTLPYLSSADKVLDVGIVGLGPVRLVSYYNYLISKQWRVFTPFECATLALLDYLVRADVQHRIVAVDPNESRRAKM